MCLFICILDYNIMLDSLWQIPKRNRLKKERCFGSWLQKFQSWACVPIAVWSRDAVKLRGSSSWWPESTETWAERAGDKTRPSKAHPTSSSHLLTFTPRPNNAIKIMSPSMDQSIHDVRSLWSEHFPKAPTLNTAALGTTPSTSETLRRHFISNHIKY